RARIQHLLHEVAELPLALRARLRQERACVRDDVAGCPAPDETDIRGRLLVDTAETQIGNRLGRRLDRRSSFLGRDPRMRRAPAFRIRPSSTTGRSSPEGGTVSRWAQKNSGVPSVVASIRA